MRNKEQGAVNFVDYPQYQKNQSFINYCGQIINTFILHINIYLLLVVGLVVLMLTLTWERYLAQRVE